MKSVKVNSLYIASLPFTILHPKEVGVFLLDLTFADERLELLLSLSGVKLYRRLNGPAILSVHVQLLKQVKQLRNLLNGAAILSVHVQLLKQVKQLDQPVVV